MDVHLCSIHLLVTNRTCGRRLCRQNSRRQAIKVGTRKKLQRETEPKFPAQRPQVVPQGTYTFDAMRAIQPPHDNPSANIRNGRRRTLLGDASPSVPGYFRLPHWVTNIEDHLPLPPRCPATREPLPRTYHRGAETRWPTKRQQGPRVGHQNRLVLRETFSCHVSGVQRRLLVVLRAPIELAD